MCDPKEISQRDLRHITRRYIADLGANIGPAIDIPAPDVNTNQRVMAWMLDEYSKLPTTDPNCYLSAAAQHGRL